MSKGRFGIHGGQYIPETLMNAVIELEDAYNHYKDDPDFNRELTELFNEYAGRPSRLYFARRMTEELGGAKIYLKREGLNHTGSLPRPARASTAWPLPRPLPSWGWNVLCSWAKKIRRGRL